MNFKWEFISEQKYICVSRPRRFGKSMALKMLAAYYSCGCDSRELFAGLEIASDPAFGEYLNQYDMIFLNMQQFLMLVGVNCDKDSENKPHSCVIEKMVWGMEEFLI